MDGIADSVFSNLPTQEELSDNPSLLSIVLDLNPESWYAIRDKIALPDLTKSLLVFLNAHLSLHGNNQVAFIVSLPLGSRILHPAVKPRNEPPLVNPGMYRHFRLVDDTVLSELNRELEAIAQDAERCQKKRTLALAGALSLALTYQNRMLHLDLSISTTTASAISATTALGQSAQASQTAMGARVLVISANDTHDVNYIAIMNAIFAAQKMGVSIDVAKLGPGDSPYLQQAADTTNGVYLHIQQPQGLVQILCTAFFIEPCLRNVVVLPTNTNVNYKASCFVTGKPVDIGYVCSVCLCIMSELPKEKCPTCGSQFDEGFMKRYRPEPSQTLH